MICEALFIKLLLTLSWPFYLLSIYLSIFELVVHILRLKFTEWKIKVSSHIPIGIW